MTIHRITIWGAMLVYACCSVQSFAQQNPPSRGREVTQLYAGNCGSCHGAEMAGGTGPGLLNLQWNFAGDDRQTAASIQTGHRTMAGAEALRTLNNAEVRGLVILIHERSIAAERAHTTFKAPKVGEVVGSEGAPFKLESVVDGTLEDPWALAFLPDGRLLVTERPGRLRIVENGRLLPEPVTGMPAIYGGEGGLLHVALHPRYSEPGQDWIYLSYGDKAADGEGMTAVIRGKLRNSAFVEQQQIFKADPTLYRPGGQRYGSRLVFDPAGHLLFSIGDHAHPGDEQDLSKPNGKIHRVNADGSIPTDNPFARQTGAMPSIWTYGHRNPQGLVFDPQGRELWETEHGPRGGDELNVIERGHNYGWPTITFGMNYDGTPITDQTEGPGVVRPITNWVPSLATGPIAFYTGDKMAQWKDNLFLGSLGTQELRRLVIKGHVVQHQEVLFKGIGRVRDLVNGPGGYLYVVLNQPGRIVRLVPASGTETSVAVTGQR